MTTEIPLEASEADQPFRVKCADCAHLWVAMYLPQPISVAAKILKKATCPKCGASSARIFANHE